MTSFEKLSALKVYITFKYNGLCSFFNLYALNSLTIKRYQTLFICQELLLNMADYVGFANLPNQVHRKSVKKGFEFTLMVVGKHYFICISVHFWMLASLGINVANTKVSRYIFLIRCMFLYNCMSTLVEVEFIILVVLVNLLNCFHVVGESGLGKSTLIDSLFLTDLYSDRILPKAEGTNVQIQTFIHKNFT